MFCFLTNQKTSQTRPIFTFSRLMAVQALALLCAFVWTPLAHSARVQNVSVKGNKIIETSLIKSHIQLKKGSIYSEKAVQKDVRQLFSLGFFDYIEARKSAGQKGVNIIYKLKERIHIGQVEFKGNDSVKTDDLKDLSLVKEHSFLNFDKLKKTFSAIKEKYKEKGYYLAEVSYKTEQLPKEKKIKLIIQIEENRKLLIKKINFVGNRNIRSEELKAFLLTRERNILSFLGSSGIFQPKFIERDLQFIEYYYRDKGWLNVRAHQPEITITPDKRFLYITFSISEGPRFKIGQAGFQGDGAVSSEQVAERLSLRKQEYFSLSRLHKDMQMISLLYKDQGYAFVQVKPLFYPDPAEEDKIHILFKAEKGEIYKVRRIRLLGNKNTRDKTLFRRFQIREGDRYSESRKELSKQLLQQLGYFEKIEIEPVPGPAGQGELDLLVRVEERDNTGEAHIAGGYNSQTRLFIQGGVKKQNLLGLDQSVALNLNFSAYSESFSFSYQNPYFLDSRWNFAFDVFNVAQSSLSRSGSIHTSPVASLFSSQDYFSYFRLDTGFSVSIGRHLTEFSTMFLKYKLQSQSLSRKPVFYFRKLPILSPVFQFLFGAEAPSPTASADQPAETSLDTVSSTKNSPAPAEEKEQIQWISDPRESITFTDIYPLEEGTGLNSSLSVIWEYDKRNDRFYASAGWFARLSAEYSGLGGDFNYTKLQGKLYHYYSPFWKLVIKNRLDYGWVFSNIKGRKALFTELFLLGGPYNLRGFQVNSQGPRKLSQDALKYAHNYNRRIIRAKEELSKQKRELAQWESGPSDKDEKTAEKIREMTADITQNERWAESQPLKYPEAFAQRPYGGAQMFFYSLELEIPLIEKAQLRAAVFFDIGEANDRLRFDLSGQLRANVGAGIRWKSPFGPLNLDLAVPYKPRKEYNEQEWEFQIGMSVF